MACGDSGRLHAYLILAQLAFAGFQILSRIALTNGTHALAFTFYRNCFASLLLGTLAYFTERQQKRPSFRSLLYFFLLGFIGVTVNQVFYLTGLKYTTAILASAMRNSTPVFTFIIAALWRIERVDIWRRDGQLKVLGSMLGLCGSLVLSVYRGPVIIHSNISITGASNSNKHSFDADATKTLQIFGLIRLSLVSWQIGAIFLTISCVAFGAFLILQSPVLENYPAPISFAAFACFSSVVQVPLLGLIYERKWSLWKISSTTEALAVLYAGVIGSGLVSSIQSWGVLKRGPVVVAAYQPLETIFTAFFSMIFLREDLHLGSVLGGVVVILGLYSLIWGQHIERRRLEEAEDCNPWPDALQLPQAPIVMFAELHPTLATVKYPLRRYSCDLETRRTEMPVLDSVQRRHSLAFGGTELQQGDAYDQNSKQGPLRRMSSTFRSIFRDPEKGPADLERTDSQQLLPEKTEAHNSETR